MNINFSTRLIDWYADHKRHLPWRETSDPYRIWISEIILQQTRVAQGYDYFLRFIHRFPDVRSLAEASDEEVMKLWQGLGYYSRARHLHQAAGSMQGVFPSTYAEVRALKGVGDYTAAAICSFAYNMPCPVVDGNVYRVLARYFGIDTPIDTTNGKKLFAALADEMLDRQRPAVYNQAIMDFGALQCTPQSPDCLQCPLVDGCVAAREGRTAQLPVKQHKVKTSCRYLNYIYVRARANEKEYTFLKKRTANDIWQNLYEFPLIESDAPLSEEAFKRLPQLSLLFAADELSTLHVLCRDVKHVLTHRIIYANLYEVTLSESSAALTDYIKVDVNELGEYAVPRLIQTFIETCIG
ncbi:MAG: A/G-specific adenine glycosylase [Prevotellaceae bacterium]|jgi:A/G-specific adenine glycosylase|nr:A/G-specific adenine glycosylase [Prevotellaceae bacterium]